MPVTHLYDGAQRSNGRKKHTAPINPIEKQRRKQEKWERDHKFNHLIDNLLTHIDDEVQKIHKETNSSISFIRSALGIAGSELKGTRSENAHNAWVRGRMKEINDENEQKGEERMSLPDFKEQYGHEYAQLTPAEREAYCTALTEHRKLQHPTEHKTYKAASIDIDYTVNQVNDILRRLEMRTGYLTFFVGHRGDPHSLAKPTFYISPQLNGFLDGTFKVNISDFIMKSELYALHGLQGVAQNAHEQHSARKQIVVQYLQNSLQNATGRTSVRLNYVNFTEKIVLGHGVDLVGWPQGVGLNAGGLTRANLQRVFDGVTADPPTIYFKKLTPDEHAEKKEAWDLAQHAKSTTQAPQPSSPSLTNVQSLPTPDSQAQTIPHLVELVPTPPVTPSPSPACPTHPSSYGATATLEAPVQSTAPQAVARDASSPLAIELPELSSVADDNTSGTTQAGPKRLLDVNLVDTDVTTGATKEPVSKKQRRTGRNTGSSVARGKSPNVPAESQLPIAEYSPIESTNPTTRSGRKIKKTQRANFVENETYS